MRANRFFCLKFIRGICIVCLLFTVYVIAYSQANFDCDVKSIETLELFDNTGDLLFTPRDVEYPEVVSLLGRFVPKAYPFDTGQVSPNGERIASITTPDLTTGTKEVVVHNNSGEVIYRGSPSMQATYIRWLGNDKILLFNLTRSSRPCGSRCYYDFRYFFIDPIAQRYSVFQPPYDSNFYQGDTAIMSYNLEYYSNTYDGQYLFSSDDVIFDFFERTEPNLSNYRWGIASQVSHKLISADLDPEDYGSYRVYIYDFTTDEFTQAVSFSPESGIDYHNNSWSPNESIWAYSLSFPNRDLESFRRIEFLDIVTGESRQTCLGLRSMGEENIEYFNAVSPDFAWSHDGHYLALMAVIDGQDMNESFGLYLYDTHTEDIYLIHLGNSDIVGWIASVIG